MEQAAKLLTAKLGFPGFDSGAILVTATHATNPWRKYASQPDAGGDDGISRNEKRTTAKNLFQNLPVDFKVSPLRSLVA
jgi:hypothetical protein